jgi:ribosomal protein S18 acetylase RimI-like enzyme
MARKFAVAALDPTTDRSGFECGVKPLDQYFRVQVGQDIKRRVTACFVATEAKGKIAGYYTLASASVSLTDLPDALAKKLPRYPSVPAVRMGRLAVDQAFKSEGLGAALLADALRRAVAAEIAAYALIVDAKDETAARFYLHHGFIALPEPPLRLFIALATVKDLIKPT